MAEKKSRRGHKGGKRYPKLSLEKTLKYTNRLVNNTQTHKPRLEVLSTVFDSKTWLGIQRLSATKQFGLIQGNSKAMGASDLATGLKNASKDQITSLLQQACLSPDIFKGIYDQFVGQTTSRTDMQEFAVTLGINPTSTQECIKNFVDSMVFSSLATLNGPHEVTIYERNSMVPSSTASARAASVTKSAEGVVTALPGMGLGEGSVAADAHRVNVNIDIQADTDPENLKRCLDVLKAYGAM